jgi:hypothetical protein
LRSTTYRPLDIEGLPPYDVAKASTQILRTLKELHSGEQPRGQQASPFWDVLSDTILILYGIESELGLQPHQRHRLSLRDLETAWEVKNYFDHVCPSKRIYHIIILTEWTT